MAIEEVWTALRDAIDFATTAPHRSGARGRSSASTSPMGATPEPVVVRPAAVPGRRWRSRRLQRWRFGWPTPPADPLESAAQPAVDAERRLSPNAFVRQTSDDIVAAVPNPDVLYAFSWWRVGAGEALVIGVDPADAPYWAVQLCDRWFQCFPERRSNLDDRRLVRETEGSVRIVVADGEPGHPNRLDTSGHRLGTIFFRWLHADPDVLPTCRIVAHHDVAALAPPAEHINRHGP